MGYSSSFFTCFLLLALLFVADGQPLVPAFFIFGDSVVDVGNNNDLYTIVKANFPPYGRDFKNHMPTGRFCNGKLASDFTAENLGFTSYPPAYLNLKSKGRNLLNGANFASAASGYYESTAKLYHAIPLSQQLEHYRDCQNTLVEVAGQANASSIISGAINLISAGNSDFIQNYYINPLLYKVYTADQFSDILIQCYCNFIKACLSQPCLVASSPKLNATSQSLQKMLPGLNLVLLDIYQPFYELVTKPSANGFFEARKACCGTGLLETSILCNHKSIGTCANASEYVFWDGFHPSEAANKVLADKLLTAGISLIS
ncbi:hypothetical protein L6164_019009 [Bauhinia variegata]|uniref:Uncharacterized protein n=1 Tax=Bauhinia variegata TaxID=167791 RepID=A0ACB9NEQ0_BAUVA|nr:hypothetical protein L6164_019009 [Bauhinia variegata]